MQQRLAVERRAENGASFNLKEVIMMKTIDDGVFKELLALLIQQGLDAFEEYRNNRADLFRAGKSLAYYEVLDVIKTKLDVEEIELSKLGLDIDLDKII